MRVSFEGPLISGGAAPCRITSLGPALPPWQPLSSGPSSSPEPDALPGEEGEFELARAVRRVRLLRSWTAAGLSIETILTLVNRGALSLAFLDAPVMALPERLDRSYEQLAAERGVPMSLVQALHQSLGFAPPEPSDRAGADDATMLEVSGCSGPPE